MDPIGAFAVIFVVVFVFGLIAKWNYRVEQRKSDQSFAVTRHPDRARNLYRQYILEYNMTARANGRPDYYVADADRYTANDLAWARAWAVAGDQIMEWEYQEDWNQEHGRLLYNNALKSGRWHKYRH